VVCVEVNPNHRARNISQDEVSYMQVKSVVAGCACVFVYRLACLWHVWSSRIVWVRCYVCLRLGGCVCVCVCVYTLVFVWLCMYTLVFVWLCEIVSVFFLSMCVCVRVCFSARDETRKPTKI
jgi:hypothetical protein